MMSMEEMCRIVTQAMKDVQLELARKWGFPSGLFAVATFGLGITMMHESGYTEEQIVEIVRRIIGELAASPSERGAS